MSLSVSDLVSVSVNLSPKAVPTANFGSLALLGSSDRIDVSERIRKYSSLDGVLVDFATTDPEYKAAALFYAQVPQPKDLFIGKWAEAAVAGRLYGGALSTAQQALSAFTAVSDGGMKVDVDGTEKDLADLDFSLATTLPGIATIVTTALASSATVTYDSVNKRFMVKSATTGTTSTVSFATAPDTGTDVSLLLNLTSALSAKAVGGVAAESMLDGVKAIAAKSNDFFGLAIATASPADDDILAVAEYIEATNRFLVTTTQDADALDASSTDDLAYKLKDAGYNRTACQYSSSSPFAAVSMFARQASVAFDQQSSTITLQFKNEVSVQAEDLTESSAATLAAKNCNVFVKYNNSTAIIQHGTVASGQYIDSIVGLSWLSNALQVALFNALYTSTTKIPQTDPGVNQLVATAHQIMDSAVNNGLVAPGVWTGPAIGAIKTGQTLTAGYYIFAPLVATQSLADRAARKSPSLQIAVKLGGAIHSVDLALNVVQ